MTKEFIDTTSGLNYKWNKEEKRVDESLSCWSAKDQFGCKDYFILKEESVIAGPFETLKEAIEKIDDKINSEEVEEATDLINTEGKEEEKYYKVGAIDDLYQLVIAEAELIRKYQSALIHSDASDRGEFVGVFNDIISLENENIGKIQAMIKSLTNTAEAIDDGDEEVANQLDVDENANISIDDLDDVEVDLKSKDVDDDVEEDLEEDLEKDFFSLSMGEALQANLFETTNADEQFFVKDPMNTEGNFFEKGKDSEEDLIQKELSRRYSVYCDD